MTGFNPIHDKLDAILKHVAGDKDALKKDRARRLKEEDHRIRRDWKGRYTEREGDGWDEEIYELPSEKGGGMMNPGNSGRMADSQATLVPGVETSESAPQNTAESRRTQSNMARSPYTKATYRSGKLNLPSLKSFARDSSYRRYQNRSSHPKKDATHFVSHTRKERSPEYYSTGFPQNSARPSMANRSAFENFRRSTTDAGTGSRQEDDYSTASTLASQRSSVGQYVDPREAFRNEDSFRGYRKTPRHTGSYIRIPDPEWSKSQHSVTSNVQLDFRKPEPKGQLSSYADPRQMFAQQNEDNKSRLGVSGFTHDLSDLNLRTTILRKSIDDQGSRRSGLNYRDRDHDHRIIPEESHYIQDSNSVRSASARTPLTTRNAVKGSSQNYRQPTVEDFIEHDQEPWGVGPHDTFNVTQGSTKRSAPSITSPLLSRNTHHQRDIAQPMLRRSISSPSPPLATIGDMNRSFIEGMHGGSVTSWVTESGDQDEEESAHFMKSAFQPSVRSRSNGSWPIIDDSKDGRKIGDMTRTFVEGMRGAEARGRTSDNDQLGIFFEGNKTHYGRQIGDMSRTHLEGMDDVSKERLGDHRRKRWYNRH